MKISLWKDTEDEKYEILNLTKKTFGDVEINNSSYFDWQYRNNPNGKALVLLSRDDSNNNIIVGTNTIIPTKLLVDQKEIISSLACNVQVHPDYQKKGIFLELLSSMSLMAKKKEISSLFAVPNENSFNAFIKEGSSEIIQLPLLVRPIKFSKYFNFSSNKIFGIFDLFWKIKTPLYDIEEFDGNFQNFEKLLQKASKRVSIIQNRNKEYLKWRYLDHPTRKYQIYILKKNNELIGYIIIKIHILNNKKIGVILDYLVDSNALEDSQKSLIEKALNYFWKNDVSISIVTSRSGLLENKLLRQKGFFQIPSFLKPESLHFIVRLFDSDKKLEKLNKFDNWFFSFGDYDVF
jgi:hypothetical protein